jgi:hypothetical protein
MVGAAMISHTGIKGKAALEIMEEAVHLLRLCPPGTLAAYYAGSLPFVLGLLFFWADMSRSAFAGDYCTFASMGLAALFVWMKCWHAVFAGKVMEQITREPGRHWSFRRAAHLVATQTFLHAFGIVVLPVAMVMALPFGWCYAFYQNVLFHEDSGRHGVRSMCRRSWALARLWPGQNHILLLTFSTFGAIVFLNLAIGAFLLPHIIKSLFGIETMFTMSGYGALNTTFVTAIFGLTYLCMDPLIKTVYVLRCFYGASLSTGEDLKAELKLFSIRVKGMAAFVVLLLASSPAIPATFHGQSGVVSEVSEFTSEKLFADDLDRSIENVLSRREFAWRMPRERAQEEESPLPGPVAAVIDWVLDAMGRVGSTLAQWVETIVDWVKKLFPKSIQGEEKSGTGLSFSVQTVLILCAAVLVCVAGLFFLRIWRRRSEGRAGAVAEPLDHVPDLTGENVSANELPADRWVSYAGELAQKGSLRLALRALYLAILAHLAEFEMISFAGYKSNRDYEGELRRRAQGKEGLADLFSANMNVFEKTWYGRHQVTHEVFKRFAGIQERIMAVGKE